MERGMGFIIFIVGFTIFVTYVFFFMFSTKKEIDSMPTLKDDMIDYDGHGNWGRFPPKKSRLKEGRIKTNKKTTT
jgi:hypothetical protein